MADIIYPHLGYDIQDACFDTNELVVQFRGQPIESRRVPQPVVDGRLMVVPLAVLRISSDIEIGYRHYLALLGLKQGLVVNFRTAALGAAVLAA